MKNESLKGSKEWAEWGRHFDMLLWTVTTIMAAAIGGLLVCTINKFDISLAIVGFMFIILAVYFAASFREIRHKVEEFYIDKMKRILKDRNLIQWLVYRLSFEILVIFWIRLLIENSNNAYLIWFWIVIGIIATVVIVLDLFAGKTQPSGTRGRK
ncbi:MAG: hypothetical protein V1662_04055 [Candidatus Omnitrophota bacterium]